MSGGQVVVSQACQDWGSCHVPHLQCLARVTVEQCLGEQPRRVGPVVLEPVPGEDASNGRRGGDLDRVDPPSGHGDTEIPRLITVAASAVHQVAQMGRERLLSLEPFGRLLQDLAAGASTAQVTVIGRAAGVLQDRRMSGTASGTAAQPCTCMRPCSPSVRASVSAR